MFKPSSAKLCSVWLVSVPGQPECIGSQHTNSNHLCAILSTRINSRGRVSTVWDCCPASVSLDELETYHVYRKPHVSISVRDALEV